MVPGSGLCPPDEASALFGLIAFLIVLFLILGSCAEYCSQSENSNPKPQSEIQSNQEVIKNWTIEDSFVIAK